MARKNKEAVAVAAEAPAIEQVETPGLGIDEGIVLGTFLLLLGAIVLVYFANQQYPVA